MSVLALWAGTIVFQSSLFLGWSYREDEALLPRTCYVPGVALKSWGWIRGIAGVNSGHQLHGRRLRTLRSSQQLGGLGTTEGHLGSSLRKGDGDAVGRVSLFDISSSNLDSAQGRRLCLARSLANSKQFGF